MGLFGRKRANDETERPVAETGADGIPASLPSDAEATASTVAESDDWEPETPFSRLRGPFDRAEVTRDDTRVELGSLWVAITDGVQVALQVDESTQTPVGIQLSLGTSGAYLQAYAAPRTEGIWPEIRTEVAQSVVAAGGRAELVGGPLGKELRLHQRGGVPIRLLGVDGPRWFLRALVTGPAAVDEQAGDALIEVIRKTVVDRGTQAMAPREQLPLRLPQTDGPEAARADAAPEKEPTPAGFDDLQPFERGPEITEVH